MEYYTLIKMNTCVYTHILQKVREKLNDVLNILLHDKTTLLNDISSCLCYFFKNKPYINICVCVYKRLMYAEVATSSGGIHFLCAYLWCPKVPW